MNARSPMYEGDGLIRQGLSKPTDQETASKVDDPASVLDFDALQRIEREASRLRSEHIHRLLRAALAWIGDIPRRARQDSAERYLAGSTDHADVERRIRTLERHNARAWNRHSAA